MTQDTNQGMDVQYYSLFGQVMRNDFSTSEETQKFQRVAEEVTQGEGETYYPEKEDTAPFGETPSGETQDSSSKLSQTIPPNIWHPEKEDTAPFGETPSGETVKEPKKSNTPEEKLTILAKLYVLAGALKETAKMSKNIPSAAIDELSTSMEDSLKYFSDTLSKAQYSHDISYYNNSSRKAKLQNAVIGGIAGGIIGAGLTAGLSTAAVIGIMPVILASSAALVAALPIAATVGIGVAVGAISSPVIIRQSSAVAHASGSIAKQILKSPKAMVKATVQRVKSFAEKVKKTDTKEKQNSARDKY